VQLRHAGGSGQRTIDNLGGSRRQPPPFVGKEGLYNVSPPYIIDVFLASTEDNRR
jgi:hypothetical protein